ncbi:nuclear transport factor 2 family protein [Nocardia paucivorans]|uniref:nuclear transport factor 2 family protein n=1 Tax=Nocardia paucivorans TaxID=114259 RepID=UPI0002DDDB97|nr:nuclear transport factor 2 family protein [Nocardia paucivorans]
MSPEPTAADLLATVTASPRAVSAHDRKAWVDLFTENATVNDPVGSTPHIGRAAIERFYDTFIAPNTITFDVAHDFIARDPDGPASILRDLTIRITMSTGAAVHVPMHLRYELAQVAGELRIDHLAAHWELPAMVRQLMRTGAAGWVAGAKLGRLLVRNQGIAGPVGMARAYRNVGRTGRRRALELSTAAGRGDGDAVSEATGHGSALLWSGNRISPTEFAERARGWRRGKTITAGRTITASVELADGPGLVMLEFAPTTPRIETVRVHTEIVPH